MDYHIDLDVSRNHTYIALYINPVPRRENLISTYYCRYRILRRKGLYELFWTYKQLLIKDIVCYIFPSIMYWHEKGVIYYY